jgi:hypothetical protein
MRQAASRSEKTNFPINENWPLARLKEFTCETNLQVFEHALPMLMTVWIVFLSTTATDARKRLLNQRGRCNGTRTHETAP